MVTMLAARWQLGPELYRETGDVDLGIPPLAASEYQVVDRADPGAGELSAFIAEAIGGKIRSRVNWPILSVDQLGWVVTVIELGIAPGLTEGSFRVDVVRSPAGEASAEVVLDIDALLGRREQIEHAVLASSVASRSVISQAERPLREIGQTLFSALLGSGDIAGRYRASAALAADQEQGLRVVLRIGTPALAGLPWEAMYDSVTGGYVCLREPLVRHVPVASPAPPLTVRAPLRILGIISSPRGLGLLDTDQEKEQLTRALARPCSDGLVEVHWAAEATWAALQDLLLSDRWHVLHFIGHGNFDLDRDAGGLFLVREDGRPDLVEAERLIDLLREARPMPRLVVLNSCSGATTGVSDLFASTAAALVRGGVSAVAAMQWPISDAAACAFARGFYTAIAHGRGVDEATRSGRVAIVGTHAQTLEWVTPVMYLRGHDSRLFVMDSPPRRDAGPDVRPVPPIPDRAEHAPRSLPHGPMPAPTAGSGISEAIQRLASSGASNNAREAAEGLQAMGYQLIQAKTTVPGKRRQNYLRIMDPAYTAHGIGYLTPTMFSFSRAADRDYLSSLPGAAPTTGFVNFSHLESAQPGLAAARFLKEHQDNPQAARNSPAHPNAVTAVTPVPMDAQYGPDLRSARPDHSGPRPGSQAPLLRLATLGTRGQYLDVWALRQDGTMDHWWWPGSDRSQQWSAPEVFAAPPDAVGLVADIAAASSEPGHTEVFAINRRGNLWLRQWRQGEGWAAWEMGTSQGASPVAACSLEDGHIALVMAGLDSRTVRYGYNQASAGWSAWTTLDVPGGVALTKLAAAGVRGQSLNIFGLRADGRISYWRWPRSDGEETRDEAEDWVAPGGTIDIAAASRGPGHAEVFAVDRYGNLWHRWWLEDEGWATWQKFADHVAGPVAACSYTDGHIQVFVTDPESNVIKYSSSSVPARWDTWKILG